MASNLTSTAVAIAEAPAELIERRIFVIRGHKVMMDAHLAELYGVPTFRLNEAVKRNRGRFPADFMFQLCKEEAECLISHFAMSKTGRGGRRTLPYAFTEHGVAMLSAVLSSERALQMSIAIIRAFVKMRELLATHEELAVRVERLEASQSEHASIIGTLAAEIDELRLIPEAPQRHFGFQDPRHD